MIALAMAAREVPNDPISVTLTLATPWPSAVIPAASMAMLVAASTSPLQLALPRVTATANQRR